MGSGLVSFLRLLLQKSLYQAARGQLGAVSGQEHLDHGVPLCTLRERWPMLFMLSITTGNLLLPQQGAYLQWLIYQMVKEYLNGNPPTEGKKPVFKGQWSKHLGTPPESKL